MIQRDRRPTTKKQPKQPGDLQDGVLHVPLTFTRLIGAGGMGEVWEATSDDLPGHSFAIKVIASAHVQNADVIARFFGEARAASAIDDPNIVMIHGTGRTDDGRPALVMPYIEGRSLDDLCEERGPLPVDLVAKILLQMASALRAAHSHQIVHRDIKLQNVMITNRWGREWFVVLVDFGIAKFHDAELAREIHTNTKQYVGTPGYSAPEQILGKKVDDKADMYSLGVLAYRMLCGRAPYVADNTMELMNQQLNGAEFPRPADLRPDIPPAWNDAILHCLDHDRARRPNASEFARRIASAVQNGASLLTSLAPRIAAEIRSTAKDATLSSDVPTALSQLAGQRRDRRKRLPTSAALAIGLCAGMVATGAAFKLAQRHEDMPEQASTRKDIASPAAGLGARATEGAASVESQPAGTLPRSARADHVAVVPGDAGVTSVVRDPAAPAAPLAGSADAGAVGPPGGSAVREVLAGAPRHVTTVAATSVDAGADTMAPPTTDGPAKADKPRPDKPQLNKSQPSTSQPDKPLPDKPQSDKPQRPADKRMQTAASQGTLHVEVEPWADVVVGDWQDTTPVTRKLPAGSYRMVLKKGSRTETVDVVINPNETTTVKRSW